MRLLLFALIASSVALADTVEVGSLPTDMESFEALRAELSQTPEGAAALFVVGLNVYCEDDSLGAVCISAAMHPRRQQEGDRGYDGLEPMPIHFQSLRRNVLARPYIPRSYFVGTSPQGGYELPESLTVRVNKKARDMKTDSGKVFVVSSGADNPRPVRVEKDDSGAWRVTEWSSLELGIRRPE